MNYSKFTLKSFWKKSKFARILITWVINISKYSKTANSLFLLKFHHFAEQICQNSKNKNRKKKRKTVVSLKLSQYLSIFSWVTNKHSTCSKKKCPVFTMSVNIHITKIQFYLRPWRRGFPINFAKFIRTPFLQNTSGRLLLLSTRCIHLRRANKTPFSSPFAFLLRFLFLRCMISPRSLSSFSGFHLNQNSDFHFLLKFLSKLSYKLHQ